jgi:hypothetical protein
MLNAGHDQFVTGLVFCLSAAGYLATLNYTRAARP